MYTWEAETGGQWKRYEDQLKSNLKKRMMDRQWETRADDRANWRRRPTLCMGGAHQERRRMDCHGGREERAAKELIT